MNDSFRTDAFVRFNPETIACACIYLAARKLQLCLPMSPPWFTLFDAHEDDLKDISLEILKLYQRSKVTLALSTSLLTDIISIDSCWERIFSRTQKSWSRL